MTKKLELSNTQAAQATAIYLSYGEKMKAIKDNGTDKEASKTAIKALRAEQKTAIKAILTPEQITKYDAMKNRKGGKRGKGKSGEKRQF